MTQGMPLQWQQRWDVSLLSLQLGDQDPDLIRMIRCNRIEQLASGGDWESTAAEVEQLDAVLTVDTAMAHLAGSLGVPSVLLLNKVHDWRWGSAQSPVPWYPSQTVLRCRQPHAWEPVLQEADSCMNTLLNG